MTTNAAPTLHSIWLMPAAEDEAILQAAVDALAAEFSTPRFRPHLTVEGDMLTTAADLASLIAALAEGRAAITTPIDRIDCSDLYFRSFYARFQDEAALIDLRRASVDRIPGPPERLATFMPHVSLLYGPVDAEPKARARCRWTEALRHRPIRFDRLAAVRSANDIPIDDWTILATAALG